MRKAVTYSCSDVFFSLILSLDEESMGEGRAKVNTDRTEPIAPVQASLYLSQTSDLDRNNFSRLHDGAFQPF